MPQIGRYEIIRELGRGGMGVVFFAYDGLLKRNVAIKSVLPAADAQVSQRLVREAQAAASLAHRNIVAMYDIVLHGAETSIVMEYVDGATLAQTSGATKTENFPQVLSVMRQCAEGLDYAHSRGIVHRDIKPSNIIITNSGEAKIADFGIAKILDSSTLLTHGMVVGTLEYISPEQLDSRPLDGRSDQYSLAAMAYRTLTGTPVFTADNVAAWCKRISMEDPVPASRRSAAVPPAVDAVLKRALAKDPARRYSSCADFVAHLASALESTSGKDRQPKSGIRTGPISSQVRNMSSAFSSLLVRAAPELSEEPVISIFGGSPPKEPAIEKEPQTEEQSPDPVQQAKDLTRVMMQSHPDAPPLSDLTSPPAIQAPPPLVPTAPPPLTPGTPFFAGSKDWKWYALGGAVAVIAVLALLWNETAKTTPQPMVEQREVVKSGPPPAAEPKHFVPVTEYHPRTVNPKDGLAYLWVPPGTFLMGCSQTDLQCRDDEKPQHQVTISSGFRIGQTPVTVAAYKRYANEAGIEMPREPMFKNRMLNPGWRNEELPMTMVTWQEAAHYCSWVGVSMRLPTEAEWEYAARGGKMELRYGQLEEIAWFAGNSGDRPLDIDAIRTGDMEHYDRKLLANGNGPQAVGRKQANDFGLNDMLGNVWQWTSDWYGAKYYSTNQDRDPQGPLTGQLRTLRGGSWYNTSQVIRVSYRLKNLPSVRLENAGFRCVGE